MSALNCSVSRPAGVRNCMVPSGAFLSGVEKATMMTSHCGETSRSGKVEPATAIAGPITDEPVAVRRAACRDCRDRGRRRARRLRPASSARRARLGRGRKRLRVREAVRAAETLRHPGIPRAAGLRSADDSRIRPHGRRRLSTREYCSWGWCSWAREGNTWMPAPVPPQAPWFPGRIQPGNVFPGAAALRPWSRGSCNGIVDELARVAG